MTTDILFWSNKLLEFVGVGTTVSVKANNLPRHGTELKVWVTGFPTSRGLIQGWGYVTINGLPLSQQRLASTSLFLSCRDVCNCWMILSCSFCQWLNLVSNSSFSHWRFWQVADNCSTSRPLALRRLSILYGHKQSNCKSKDHSTCLRLHRKPDLPLNYLPVINYFTKGGNLVPNRKMPY